MASQRLRYIDWLRVLAVLLLFPFHVGRVFNAGEAFYVKGPEVSDTASRVMGFFSFWHMPLLFLLAGASTYLALGRRSRKQYAGERLRRLLVPFVFGMLVLIPPQTWYGARFNSGYDGSYPSYLFGGDFLQVEAGRDDYFGGLGTGHLWFILYLLVFSLVALPLWGGRRGEGSRLAGLSRFLAHPVGWLATGVALGAIAEFLDFDGENPGLLLRLLPPRLPGAVLRGVHGGGAPVGLGHPPPGGGRRCVVGGQLPVGGTASPTHRRGGREWPSPGWRPPGCSSSGSWGWAAGSSTGTPPPCSTWPKGPTPSTSSTRPSS